jgi:ribosomal 50S subunit-associated protein YjgA (DUF615 family)
LKTLLHTLEQLRDELLRQDSSLGQPLCVSRTENWTSRYPDAPCPPQ